MFQVNRYRCIVLSFCLGVTLMSLPGCGSSSDRPELGKVTGTITIGGKPLSGTIVVFFPDNGRPSRGRTDADGKYELTYIGNTPGAKIGHHRVEIAPNEEDEDPSEIEAATAGESMSNAASSAKVPKVKVPARYNVNSELNADVKVGDNVFDFSLEL